MLLGDAKAGPKDPFSGSTLSGYQWYVQKFMFNILPPFLQSCAIRYLHKKKFHGVSLFPNYKLYIFNINMTL